MLSGIPASHLNTFSILALALLCFCTSCLALFGGHCSFCALPRHPCQGLATTYTFSGTHPVIFLLLDWQPTESWGRQDPDLVPHGPVCLPWALLFPGGGFITVFQGFKYLLSALCFLRNKSDLGRKRAWGESFKSARYVNSVQLEWHLHCH